MKESTLVKWGRDFLEAHGFWTLKFHGSPFSVAGIPDVLSIKAGKALWIEFKLPGNEPTKIQNWMMEKLRRFGCDVIVVHDKEEMKEQLIELLPRYAGE